MNAMRCDAREESPACIKLPSDLTRRQTGRTQHNTPLSQSIPYVRQNVAHHTHILTHTAPYHTTPHTVINFQNSTREKERKKDRKECARAP